MQMRRGAHALPKGCRRGGGRGPRGVASGHAREPRASACTSCAYGRKRKKERGRVFALPAGGRAGWFVLSRSEMAGEARRGGGQRLAVRGGRYEPAVREGGRAARGGAAVAV